MCPNLLFCHARDRSTPHHDENECSLIGKSHIEDDEPKQKGHIRIQHIEM